MAQQTVSKKARHLVAVFESDVATHAACTGTQHAADMQESKADLLAYIGQLESQVPRPQAPASTGGGMMIRECQTSTPRSGGLS